MALSFYLIDLEGKETNGLSLVPVCLKHKLVGKYRGSQDVNP